MSTRTTFQEKNVRVFNPHTPDISLADLFKDCRDFNVLGLDCEWIPASGQRENDDTVALLQLATARGNVFLFRTCSIDYLPRKLIDLLEDNSILKVGVNIEEDVQKLTELYGVYTKGFIDVRYVIEIYDPTINIGELPSLAEKFLKMQYLGHDDSFHTKWTDDDLDSDHLMYAAKGAYISMELFKEFVHRLKPRKLRIPMEPIDCHGSIGIDMTNQKYIKGAANLAKWRSSGHIGTPPFYSESYARSQSLPQSYSDIIISSLKSFFSLDAFDQTKNGGSRPF